MTGQVSQQDESRKGIGYASFFRRAESDRR